MASWISGHAHTLQSKMGCAGDKYANAPVSVTELAGLDGCVERLSVVLKLSSRGTRPALRWECSHCARLMLRNNIYEFIQRRVAEAWNVTSVDTRRGHRANSHAAGLVGVIPCRRQPSHSCLAERSSRSSWWSGPLVLIAKRSFWWCRAGWAWAGGGWISFLFSMYIILPLGHFLSTLSVSRLRKCNATWIWFSMSIMRK